MNRILLLAALGAGLLLMSGCEPKQICAPDKIFCTEEASTLLVADRENKELLRVADNLVTVKQRQCFASPVVDVAPDEGNTLWVICEGPPGMLYQLSKDRLFQIKQFPMGHSPSALAIHPKTGNLWITQRFLNEIQEIDPGTGKVLSRLPTGREPVDSLFFDKGNSLLVIHNLPEQNSQEFPVAAQVTILNTVPGKKSEICKKILLPNGSTDVRSVTTDPKEQFAYITHLVARYQLPTNQVERGWMMTNALSLINLQTGEYLNTILLDTPQKGAANPAEVQVTRDGKNLLVALAGADELAVINLPALKERLTKSRNGEKVSPARTSWDQIPNDTSYLQGIRHFIPTGGKGPRSIAIQGNKIYVANYFSGDIASWDTPTASRKKGLLGAPLSSRPEGRGEMFFHDAGLCFQGWQSCASCHPNGARVDGLNWDLLNDGVGTPKNTKSLLLAHQTPPCMITGIRKNAETAVRSGMKHILFTQPDENIARNMDDYLISLKPVLSPRRVNGGLSESASRGKAHFDTHCAACHTGRLYTDKKQYPVTWTTGKNKGNKMDVPTLREIWRTAPYLYDGRAATMRDMLKIHGPHTTLTPAEMNDLEEFVLSL